MNEMLSAGVEIMLIGMGIVYAFLAMLILAINGMSAIIRRFFPELPAVDIAKRKAPVGEDPGTIAAIAAAIHHHRTKNATTKL